MVSWIRSLVGHKQTAYYKFLVTITVLPLRQKWPVYKSYVRPAILYGSEAGCLKESEMGILRRTERSMVRAMCGA